MQADNPYAAPRSAIEDPRQPAVALASRGARLVASVVDGIFSCLLIYGVPLILFGAAVLPALGVPLEEPLASQVDTEKVGAASLAISLGGIVVLVVNLFFLRHGATVGKKMLGIKIVRRDGSKASIGRIFFLRMLLNSVLYITMIYGLIDILAIFREDRRCVHDLIAGTIVVNA